MAKIFFAVAISLMVIGCSPSQEQVDLAVQKEMQKREDEKQRIFGYIDQYVSEKGGLPGGGQRPPSPGAQPPAPSLDEKIKSAKKVDIGDAPVKGYKNAKVSIVVFSDFQCPFCSKANPTIEELLKKYAGKIKIAFKHQPLPMHPEAKIAAQAGVAAHKQGKFWQMHDKMFSNQMQLKKENLISYAEELGLNVEQFKKDLESPKTIAAVEKDMQQAQSVGANGTPTFFINGVDIVGAQPVENFSSVIDKLLSK